MRLRVHSPKIATVVLTAMLALAGSACGGNPFPVATPPQSQPGGTPPNTQPGASATLEDAGPMAKAEQR